MSLSNTKVFVVVVKILFSSVLDRRTSVGGPPTPPPRVSSQKDLGLRPSQQSVEREQDRKLTRAYSENDARLERDSDEDNEDSGVFVQTQNGSTDSAN